MVAVPAQPQQPPAMDLFFLLGLAVGASATFELRSQEPNMNGRYTLTQTPGGNDTLRHFPMEFRSYPGGAGYFEVYSPPMTTLYSQVFWAAMPPVDIPKEIVEHFTGKGMAIIGMEADQVRRTAKGDVSVPVNAVYNHHYDLHVVGRHAAFEKLDAHDPRLHSAESGMASMGHGPPVNGMYIVKDLGTSDGSIPISQELTCGNGGEFRKTFRGIAPGYAQVVDSPTQVQIVPMMIDTWNREKMDIDQAPSKFVAGPLPSLTQAPPNATYSGLLECPLTTRYHKDIQGSYELLSVGKCTHPITTVQECFSAAQKELGPSGMTFNFTSGPDLVRPSGCSVAADPTKMGQVVVHYSTGNSPTACGSGAALVVGAATSLVHLEVEIDVGSTVTLTISGPSDVWFGVGFNATGMKDAPWAVIVDGTGNVSERQLAKDGSGHFVGAHDPGHVLMPSVEVKRSTVEGGRRTVTLSRALRGRGPEYFSFERDMPPLLRFINAVGSTPLFGIHKKMAASSVALLPVAAAAGASDEPRRPLAQLRWLSSQRGSGQGSSGLCLCSAKEVPFGTAAGFVEYVRTTQPEDKGGAKAPFGNHCPPGLLAEKNPTCDVRTYAGGGQTCYHMTALLDADQLIPWPDQPLTYYLKFRFWFQEYNASYHRNVNYNGFWMIASPIEFDVPKCAEGMLGCSKLPDGTWIHTIAGTFPSNERGLLVEGHFHCHAPTCLTFELYMCPPGTPICNGTTGRLLCHQVPVYGGKGLVEPKFDEEGYLLLPPCKWGSSEFGLEPPPDVTGQVLGMVKTSNATNGHTGEMVAGQVLIHPLSAKDYTFV